MYRLAGLILAFLAIPATPVRGEIYQYAVSEQDAVGKRSPLVFGCLLGRNASGASWSAGRP
jgi:hypothetical protein